MTIALETAPRRAHARRPDLFESKLERPDVRIGAVEKRALVDRLCACRTATLVDVVAPAGYGKTTLLGAWEARDRRPFAWLSADGSENDPRVLVSYLAATLARIVDVDPTIDDALGRRGRSGWRAALYGLGAAVASSPPLVLVIDDAHLVQEPDCLDVLTVLVEHLRDGSALALGARAEPQLPLGRLRARGRLLEIGPADLSLDEDEARALLEEAGLAEAAAIAPELTRRTEGWPAGLFLAGLALREEAADDADGFADDDRCVADYLRLEVLSRLSPDELEFVRGAAVLQRMSGPLCDAVLGRSGSAGMLESLERANVFLVALDRQRRWYRFHHLFREQLLAELDRSAPDLVCELSGRAADWCAENGAPEAAIAYADAAGDHDRIADIVATVALPDFDGGRTAPVQEYLALLDGTRCVGKHAAAAAAGLICALNGRTADADRWADSLAAEAAAEPEAALLRAALCRDGAERMHDDAAAAVERLGCARGWRPPALLVLGAAHQLLGDAASADMAFAAAVEAAAVEGAAITGSIALAQRSLLARERNEPAESAAYARDARALVRAAELEDCPAVALVHAVAARAAVAAGDSAGARPELAAARRLRPRLAHALPWLAVVTRLELARAHVAVAEYTEAKALLAEVDALLRRRPDLGVLVDRLHELRAQTDGFAGPAARWASTLTDAELRLLPLLTTHLSFREIAERLYISRNTVKTQAVSMYRKLGVSSRGDAIERAADLGLVDRSAVAAPRR